MLVYATSDDNRKTVRMNLEEIEIALSVIRNKSFSLAARELSYSQPTISKRIDSLEKELSVKLFNRKTRSRIELTSEGEQLMPFFEEVQQATRSLMNKAAAISKDGELILRVACPNGMSTLGEDEILLKFGAIHNVIKIEQLADSNLHTLQMLKDHQIDAGFVARVDDFEYSEMFAKTWEIIDIREFRMKIALSERHPLAKQDDLTLSDFKNDSFLFKSYRDDMRTDPKVISFIEACRMEGFDPKIKFIEGRGSLLFGLVASGKYVAPLMHKPRISRQDVHIKQLGKDYYHFKLQLFYDKSNDSAALRTFIDFVKKLNISLD